MCCHVMSRDAMWRVECENMCVCVCVPSCEVMWCNDTGQNGMEWFAMWLWPSVVGCEVRFCDEGWSWHAVSWKMLWSTGPTSQYHDFVLQSTTRYYTAITILQTTKSYKVLQCTIQNFTVILCTAKYYPALLSTIVYNRVFSVLQARYYSILLRTTKYYQVLQRTHYSIIQSTTPYYRVLYCYKALHSTEG